MREVKIHEDATTVYHSSRRCIPVRSRARCEMMKKPGKLQEEMSAVYQLHGLDRRKKTKLELSN